MILNALIVLIAVIVLDYFGQRYIFSVMYDPFLKLPRFQNTTLRFLVTNPYIQVQRICKSAIFKLAEGTRKLYVG
jgi:hypothetical protein